MTAFPFSAIVGQDDMKQALLIASVEPAIGGVLVFGDRGTGKSTAVRALAQLLPTMKVFADDPYHSDPENAADRPEVSTAEAPYEDRKTKKVSVPVVDLPLGVTEDRVVGALDLEKALTLGEKAFEPGLLARAHRGFLYIDEVNLLEDHIVDLLLDVAASGENVVEREGLSVRHPARFVLIGSGNPEEGELRPQLLDRFGLSVDVSTPTDLKVRVEVVKRRDAFDQDREGFIAAWKSKDARVRSKINKAKKLLPDVVLSDAILEKASELCLALGTDGLRGELTLMRAARAIAALEGKSEVTMVHLKTAAPLSLRHRLRRNVLDDGGSATRVERVLEDHFA